MNTAAEVTPRSLQSSPARYRPYRAIHKALRAAMSQTLLQLGQADAAFPDEVESALAGVEQLLAQMELHLNHENDYMHAALKERAPQACADFDQDHVHHRQSLAALRDSLALLRGWPGPREELLYGLFLDLSAFVGENLTHMREEETRLTEIFWDHFSDAEIHEIEARLKASIAPEAMGPILRAMAFASNHGERVEMLAGAKANAPAPVFEGIVGLFRAGTPAAAWPRVAAAVGVPA